MTPPAPNRLLTTAEACEQLRIGLSKLYELMRSGEIASIMLPSQGARTPRQVGQPGGRPSRRIEQSEIDAFIARNRVQA